MTNDIKLFKGFIENDEPLRRLNAWGTILDKDSNVLDAIRLESGYAALESSHTASYWAFNHVNKVANISPSARDQGLTFFTRPRLNLTYSNIIKERRMTNLAATGESSIHGAIRAYLDPVGSVKHGFTSPLVDPKSAFIPLLSNNLVSLSGFPDPFVDSYSSKDGRYKESWGMVDGSEKIYGKFNITCNFRSIEGDAIALLMYYWMVYSSLVYEGILIPHFDSILENEIDYQTRIYRITLDRTRTYVTHMAIANAGFPTTANIGSFFDYSKDQPLNQPWQDTSVTFQCYGAEYLDPILVKEFNDVVAMFNGDMIEGKRHKKFHKLSHDVKPIFNFLGYPRINPDTSELEWWIDNDDVTQIKKMGVLNK